MMNAHEQRREQLVEELFRELLTRLPAFQTHPGSTYRLQLNKDFRFADATALVPYLAKLGVTHVYCSPYLKAAPGSGHGYDVVDHRVLNPELGAVEDFTAFIEALERHGMKHIVDFVPNHMAIGSLNPYWMDVLENGPSSIHAHFFDIDWKPVKEELENRVLVPILGDQYGAVLEKGELKLSFEGGAFWLSYWDHRFPITPRQYTQVLRHRLPELEKRLGEGDLNLQDLLSIINALDKLPPRSETNPERIIERNREKEVIKRRLIALCEGSPEVREFIEENVRIFNGTPGEPRSFDHLDRLLTEQAYRLAYWRVAAEEINYRRFFDVNTLAAIRMEDPRVMREAHSLVFELIGDGKLAGLRIDHPDGLFRPSDYFNRLQEEFTVAVGRRVFREWAAKDAALLKGEDGADRSVEEAWAELEPRYRERCAEDRLRPGSKLRKPLYVVVEKILAHGETVPASWAVHGTTGYDFMNLVNGIFIDRDSEREMTDLFARFTGRRVEYAELIYATKRQIMADSLASEINVLARQLNRISELDRRTRDFTLNSLRRALVEVVACFPVYRTYVDTGAPPDDHDVRYVELAVRRAKRKNPTVNASIFDFIRDVLLMRMDDHVTEEVRLARLAFVQKLQQVSAPVMAKGVEDTAFYVYNRLASLNEVGGEPNVFGRSVEEFHRENLVRLRAQPGSLLATSTHDTKRSEDVRARIDVLSEIPAEWRRRVVTWTRLNKKFRKTVGERQAPDKNEELLLYQTLVGTWPFEPLDEKGRAEYVARIQAYMLKAMKEGKVNTSWTNSDEDWEKAVTQFIADILDARRGARFLEDFQSFQRTLTRAGAVNAIAQLALKVTAPGVPDIYQGNELWDLSLVDPDNRRPVNYGMRGELLDAIDAQREEQGRAALADELVARFEDGRIKLYVATELLRLRRAAPELFERGDYVPLTTGGAHAHHAVAFARRQGDDTAVVVVVPRLTLALQSRDQRLAGEAVWADTFVEVPFAAGEELVDVFTGKRHTVKVVSGRTGLPLKQLFTGFPVVVLVNEANAERERVPEEVGEEEQPSA